MNGNYDTPLTQKGRDQARLVGKFLQERTDIKLRAAIISNVSRTRDTARIALSELAYPVETLPPNPLWGERSLGDFENRLLTEVFKNHPEYRDDPRFNRFIADYDQKAPNGENFTEVTERGWLGLEEVERQFENEDVAIFTHGHLLRCVLGKMFQLSKEQSIAMSVPNAQPIVVIREGDEYFLEGALRIE